MPTPTTVDLARHIGEIVQLRVPITPLTDTILWVDAVVVDATARYGKAQYLVQPVAGTGEAWVTAERTRPVPKEEKP